MAWYGDDDIDEEKVVEKFLHAVLKKYTQVALAMETLLDLSELMIVDVTGPLKAVDDCKQQPSLEPVTIRGKLLFGAVARLSAGAEEGGGFGFVEQPQASAVQAGQGSPTTWWRS